MASPQVENGHTRIAHEIIEALSRARISSACHNIIWTVFRLTYGWHRKTVIINIEKIAFKTRLTKECVRDTLCQLEGQLMLLVEWNSVDLCKIEFNKNYEQWKCFS